MGLGPLGKRAVLRGAKKSHILNSAADGRGLDLCDSYGKSRELSAPAQDSDSFV